MVDFRKYVTRMNAKEIYEKKKWEEGDTKKVIEMYNHVKSKLEPMLEKTLDFPNSCIWEYLPSTPCVWMLENILRQDGFNAEFANGNGHLLISWNEYPRYKIELGQRGTFDEKKFNELVVRLDAKEYYNKYRWSKSDSFKLAEIYKEIKKFTIEPNKWHVLIDFKTPTDGFSKGVELMKLIPILEEDGFSVRNVNRPDGSTTVYEISWDDQIPDIKCALDGPEYNKNIIG